MASSLYPLRFQHAVVRLPLSVPGKLADLEILLSFSPDHFGNAVVTVTAHSTIDIGSFFFGLVALWPIFGGSRVQLNAMNRAVAQGRLRPAIDRVFPFEDAKAAYRYYEEAQPFGKVIISHN